MLIIQRNYNHPFPSHSSSQSSSIAQETRNKTIPPLSITKSSQRARVLDVQSTILTMPKKNNRRMLVTPRRQCNAMRSWSLNWHDMMNVCMNHWRNIFAKRRLNVLRLSIPDHCTVRVSFQGADGVRNGQSPAAPKALYRQYHPRQIPPWAHPHRNQAHQSRHHPNRFHHTLLLHWIHPPLLHRREE